MVFAQKYRGKILTGDVAMITKGYCARHARKWLGGCGEVYKRPGYTPCKKRYVQALFLSTGLGEIEVTFEDWD